MVELNIGLDRLCTLYEKLDDFEKEKVIRMTEGLLKSQRVITEVKINSTEIETEQKISNSNK